MADKQAQILEGKSFRENLQPDRRVPYKVDGNLSSKEISKFRNFMNEDFPHLTYGGGRNKQIVIEYPPENTCSQTEWSHVLSKVFVPEYGNLDPKLLRKSKITVRFTDLLYDHNSDHTCGGLGFNEDDEWWIAISTTYDDGKQKELEELTFVLMHELTEIDFWSKTLKNDKEAHVSIKNEQNLLLNDNDGYRNLLDEKVANRRAMKAVNRMWPFVSWSNPDHLYDEDK